MANPSKLSIALTPGLAKLVRQAVKSGEYASDNDVIRDALREWSARRSSKEQRRDELVHLWNEGLASGPGLFRDMTAIKREARRRLASETENGAG